jgi:hypothetical protein
VRVCHTITCLIQEQETLGIVPIFWKDEAKDVIDAPGILPTVAHQGNCVMTTNLACLLFLMGLLVGSGLGHFYHRKRLLFLAQAVCAGIVALFIIMGIYAR